MKKFFAALLTAFMAVSITACNSNNDQISQQQSSQISSYSQNSEVSSESTQLSSLESSEQDGQTSNPNSQTSKPTTQTSNPSSQTSKPTTQTSNPSGQTSKPTTQTSNPSSQTSKPTAQTSNPSSQTSKPSTQTSSPNNPTTSKPESSQEIPEISVGPKFQKGIVDVIETGVFYLDAIVSETGGEQSQLQISVKGQNIYLNQEGSQSYTLLYNDKGMYILYPQQKMAMSVDKSQVEGSIGQLSSTDILGNAKYEGSGKETFKGKQYDYEIYSNDNDSIKIYFDGDKPKYIVSDNGDIVEIKSLTTYVDESLFEIPSNYRIVDMPNMQTNQ